MINLKKPSFFGFSLIELMIVVVIIGVLAAIAIPQYGSYVRRSRTAEATANINSIAQYLEQYYSENNRYYSAKNGNPSKVPSSVDSGGVLSFNTSDADWTEIGAVFTNNTQLRFQYKVFAGQFSSTGTDVSASYFHGYTANMNLNASTTTSGLACSAGSMPTGTAQSFGVTQTNYANWFVVTAMGDQVLDTSAQTCSLFVKVNDRPAIYSLNDTE